MKREYKIQCFYNGEQVANPIFTTIEATLQQASYLCEKYNSSDKGYTIHQIEREFRRRNCPRVTYTDSYKTFSITLIKLHKPFQR